MPLEAPARPLAPDFVHDNSRHLSSPTRTLLRFTQKFSRGFPVLDAGCGFGRNAIALAQCGFTVVCAERDSSRIEELMRFAKINKLTLKGALLPIRVELAPLAWPFGPSCFSAVVFIHYLDILLFPSVHSSLVPGGHLYLETVGGQGQNYLELPAAGELNALLCNRFRFDLYHERVAGPAAKKKRAVKLCAQKI
jgi:SAM-dependent methyltransferase